MLEIVKSSLRKSFSMKDLGEATYILGIKIYRDRSKRLVGLSQDTYIDKVLKRFNFQYAGFKEKFSANVNWCLSLQESVSLNT